MKKYYNNPFIEIVKYDVAEKIANEDKWYSNDGGGVDEDW